LSYKRCIIAVHPWESYYEQNPDKPKEDFWLATIICPKSPKTHGINIFHCFLVAWFWNENINLLNSSAKYILDENFTNMICYELILLHNIELTLCKSLCKADLRKIQLQLNI
jgi:hypothetical protein